MDESISQPQNSVSSEFGVFAASDPRVCFLLDAAGIIISANAAARHSLPNIKTGTDLTSISVAPVDVSNYIRQCARTRGPVLGKLNLKAEDGDPVSWSCHGGLAGRAADGRSLVILRLQRPELGKYAFERLNQKVNSLNAELEWRDRAERAAAHLAAIVASSTDAIYSIDSRNIITSWNQGAEHIFGYLAEEIIGASSLRLIPLDKRSEEASRLDRIKAGKLLEPVETVRQSKDGRLIDVSVNTSPIRDRSGTIIGVSKIVRDNTLRKHAERSLQLANATFRQLIDNSPFGIFAVNADFRIAQVSQGAQKAFQNVRPLIGRDLSEALRILWAEPAASEFIGRFRHTLETGESYHAPNTVETRRDTDEVEAYDWKIEKLTLADGRPGVVCHFYDLSEHQRFEEALRASEQRFRGTFENASVGIAHVSLDGEWLELNERFCELLGYSRTELLRRTPSCIRHPDDRKTGAEPISRLIDGEVTSLQFEERYLRKDESTLWVGISVGLQRDVEGNPAYLIYVVRDISERKRAEEHQDFLMRELAHRSKNQLAVINAMAGQTARNARSMDDFRKQFGQRLHGLAVSVDLLVQGDWSGAGLRELVIKQLDAFKGDDSRLRCEGPDVKLNNTAAEAIGLALHELSTNCVKHGAWSAPMGSVAVTWTIEAAQDNPHLRLSWIERGGPRVSKPTRVGFGQIVIEQMVAQKLGAKVELSYPPAGLKWILFLPTDYVSA